MDQIRALAALPVLVAHLNPQLLPGGGTAVGLFFALSGFLIADICAREVRNINSALAFITRRIFRVFPLMLADLFVLAIGYSFFYKDLASDFWSSIWGLLTMTHMPNSFIGIGVGVLWTLQVEMAFYILAPVLVLLFGKIRGLALLSITLLGTSLFSAISINLNELTSLGKSFQSVPILYWGGALSFGVFVSLFFRDGRRPNSEFLKSKYFSWMLFGLSIVGICFLFAWRSQNDSLWQVQVLVAAAFGAILIYSWKINDKLIVIKGLPFIGRISFSIYLVHAVLADFFHYLHVSFGMPLLTLNPLVFAPLVIFISYFSFRLIELPGMKMGAWLARKISSTKEVTVNR